MNKWLAGISYEVAFWEATYTNKKTRQSLFEFSHRGGLLSLPGWDAANFIGTMPHPSEALILDVGCGMTFAPGDYIEINGERQSVNIHYIDPLAHYYNKINVRHHLNLPDVEFGMMEFLGAFYPQHNVSLVIIQNALDHSAAPIQGILHSLATLHIGGVLYLNHHLNEAEFENYRGFHQFNICVENGELIIWNKKERHNINALVKDFANIKAFMHEGYPIAVITKTAEVPENLLNFSQHLVELSTNLIRYTEEVNKPGKMLAHHIRFFLYRCVQNISKLFPWELRQNVKHLYNHVLKLFKQNEK